MAAVNKYLSDTYAKAINNSLDIHKPDIEGGRKDSWTQCFGTIIASKKIIDVDDLRDISNCQMVTGKNNVYLLENSGSTDWGTYQTISIPNTYTNTYWIWGEQIESAKTFTFYFNYCNGNGVITVKLEGLMRGSGTITINGSTTTTGETIDRNVELKAGNNEIRVTSTGASGRAGFWMVLKNSSGKVLVKTNETWRCE
jgi:hypothetical protein